MGKEEVKGVEGREIIVRVYCRKIIIFNKREKKELVRTAVFLRNQWISACHSSIRTWIQIIKTDIENQEQRLRKGFLEVCQPVNLEFSLCKSHCVKNNVGKCVMKIDNIDSYMHTFSHTETYPPHHTLHLPSLLQGVILLLLTVAQDNFFFVMAVLKQYPTMGPRIVSNSQFSFISLLNSYFINVNYHTWCQSFSKLKQLPVQSWCLIMVTIVL